MDGKICSTNQANLINWHMRGEPTGNIDAKLSRFHRNESIPVPFSFLKLRLIMSTQVDHLQYNSDLIDFTSFLT